MTGKEIDLALLGEKTALPSISVLRKDIILYSGIYGSYKNTHTQVQALKTKQKTHNNLHIKSC
jgi:hypothetical protein